MREIFRYIADYGKGINTYVLATCSLLTGLMIFVNFYFGLDAWIDEHSAPVSLLFRYMVSLTAFVLPYILCFAIQKRNYFKFPLIFFLIILAPAIFSWKMQMNTAMKISNNIQWNYYWNQVIYWPIRLLVMSFFLIVIWKISFPKESFFGFTTRNFKWKPYVLMLLIMTPLVVAASTQPDFLNMYPKLNDVNSVLEGVKGRWFYHLLHELSYGSDFISVELFFRGFLILAFIKVVGKDAILPMACFYCTIHFGKPLGECISSYFGGMLLGIVVLNTRSIVGGLIVHLGIAWLMEIGGYIGNSLFR